MRIAIGGLGIFVAVLVTACAGLPAGEAMAPPEGLILFPDSTARAQDRARYFGAEFERILERRRLMGLTNSQQSAAPGSVIGLAMSGGGIRSNAYHLGLLAGLQEEKIGGHSALDRVDYLSSVSGGSWANLGFWAWPGGLDSLVACLNTAAEVGIANAPPTCAVAVKMLRTKQDVTLFSRPGHQRKRDWKADIEASMTGGGECDLNFDEPIPDSCAASFAIKPYPIFNSTHSAVSEQASVDNIPFQTTPGGVTAIADEGSRYAAGSSAPRGPVGFSLNFKSPAPHWRWRKFFSNLFPGGSDGNLNGSSMSLAAAHSSGVVKGPGIGLLLEYFLNIQTARDLDDLRLRNKYKLSDGGKSDNTGAVPLVERRVDLLVVSHMGK
ncbi:MAG: patatin-like phospholipase family protein, partial [Pseudomonadota bacterium]|nr:patatin-like phospholipase family protein [Pseudomonadota bacterium]